MWRAGTAMTVHYYTQPLPNPLSVHAHRLPRVAHRAACVGTFVVEILLPLGAFMPLRILRLVTCASFIGLNLAINLTVRPQRARVNPTQTPPLPTSARSPIGETIIQRSQHDPSTLHGAAWP